MNNLTQLQKEALMLEVSLTATRSSGPGGQHVNKVSTKVELRFNVMQSTVLTAEQKRIVLLKLASKLTTNYDLIITSQSSRSQIKNRTEALYKFIQSIEKALTPERIRKATKPTLVSKLKRMDDKKHAAFKKALRQRPNY